MANLGVDVEAWPIEDLLAAIMTSGAPGARAAVAASRARDVALDLLADLGGIGGLGRTTADELETRLAAL